MATQAQYDAAKAAMEKLWESEILPKVPFMFRDQVSPDHVAAFLDKCAHQAVDAALAAGSST